MVPEPSVTPSPFAVWAEYMTADGTVQRRQARQVLPRFFGLVFFESAFAPKSAKELSEG